MTDKDLYTIETNGEFFRIKLDNGEYYKSKDGTGNPEIFGSKESAEDKESAEYLARFILAKAGYGDWVQC